MNGLFNNSAVNKFYRHSHKVQSYKKGFIVMGPEGCHDAQRNDNRPNDTQHNSKNVGVGII